MNRQHPASEILDRLPPQNLEAERGVIGSLLLDHRMCDEVALIVRAEDFYATANQKLFGHLMAMHADGKRFDAVLLAERLRQAGDFEAVGGAAYLAEVAQSVPYAANAVHYAKIVRDKARVRSLIHASTEVLREAYDDTADVDELLSRSEQAVLAVRDQHASDQVLTISEVLHEAFADLDARMDGPRGLGVPTGFVDLDTTLGGMRDSELLILAARPSVGKTALALNIAEHAAMRAEVPVLLVSLEMSRLELVNRLLSAVAEVDGHRMRSGHLSAEDRLEIVEASARLSQAALYIDDTATRTVMEVAAHARRLKRKHGLGLIVIDYLQLLRPEDRKIPREQQVATMTRRLKVLARELSVPVLCLSQLNRQVDATAGNHMPQLSHLRESGAIEQDADVVLLLNREEMYCTREEAEERGLRGRVELKVAKQRNGPTGTIRLTWRGACTRFENYAKVPGDDVSALF